MTACSKVRYEQRIDALFALAKCGNTRHTRRPKDEQRIYRCPRCRGWHLTATPFVKRLAGDARVETHWLEHETAKVHDWARSREA